MNVKIKSKSDWYNPFSKKVLLFISLLFISTLLFSSTFTSEANGWIPTHVFVYNEVELKEAINTAPDNESYHIGLLNDIVLKESLEIPSGKMISLAGGWDRRLVGADGMDTIIVKSGGSFGIWTGLIVTHEEGASGRGVHVEEGGEFLLQEGTVSGNSASMGGGVYNEGYFEMWGDGTEDRSICLIFDNKADFGGGVYNSGTFTTYGGEIFGNTAAVKGGGMYNSGIFDDRLDMAIYSNIALSGEGDDVFVEKHSDGWLFYLLAIIVVVGLVVVVGLLFYRVKKQKPQIKA